MKCELAAALIHRPRVLFLDEPTIGLDVSMQATVRDFVKRYNERNGATLILTSHYMDDVAQLCPRVVVIDRGKLVYDGALEELVERTRPDKRVVLRFARRRRRRPRRPSARSSATTPARASSRSRRTRSTPPSGARSRSCR